MCVCVYVSACARACVRVCVCVFFPASSSCMHVSRHSYYENVHINIYRAVSIIKFVLHFLNSMIDIHLCMQQIMIIHLILA